VAKNAFNKKQKPVLGHWAENLKKQANRLFARL